MDLGEGNTKKVGPVLYANTGLSGKYAGSFARPKSYSKKRIQMSNTADLGLLLARHVNGKNL